MAQPGFGAWALTVDSPLVIDLKGYHPTPPPPPPYLMETLQ